MPREGKSSITVNEETHYKLQESKPDGVTWDRFLLSGARVWSEWNDMLESTTEESDPSKWLTPEIMQQRIDALQREYDSRYEFEL